MAYPGRALLDHARYADLIVAAHLPAGADERRYADPTDLVMESGLPVLLVPPGQNSIQPGTVVIGWKDGRETRRAISAAMPMLEAADRVVVVQICEDGAEAPAEAELEDVVGRLERHGVVAQWQSFPKMGVEADEDLLQVAESWAADLLVLGAYGHSRLREWAFGGVTRGLMAQSAKPILFSH